MHLLGIYVNLAFIVEIEIYFHRLYTLGLDGGDLRQNNMKYFVVLHDKKINLPDSTESQFIERVIRENLEPISS